MHRSRKALKRLREGNARFVQHRATIEADKIHRQRLDSLEAQLPFAVILGCSDSRVPAEIIFDQGLGDLFVIRVAGNAVARSQIGSVEFAVETFGVSLVVVMGHTGCGLVQAALASAETGAPAPSPSLEFIIEPLRPCMKSLCESGLSGEPLLDAAVKENIGLSVDRLKEGSEIIRRLVEEDTLRVVGAEYSLETGEVNFL